MKLMYVGKTDPYIGSHGYHMPELINGKIYNTIINRHYYGNEYFLLYPNTLEIPIGFGRYILISNPNLRSNPEWKVIND